MPRITKKELELRIQKALDYATQGQCDGAHHKAHAIDQIVRALTGCPMVVKVAKDYKNEDYSFLAQGESEEYKKFIYAYENLDDDGNELPRDNRYEWNVGF